MLLCVLRIGGVSSIYIAVQRFLVLGTIDMVFEVLTVDVLRDASPGPDLHPTFPEDSLA